MNILKRIREIEAVAYPEAFRMLQDAFHIVDLFYYMECEEDDAIVHVEDNWYLLASRESGEIVDLASDSPLRMKDMIKIYRILKSIDGDITLDAREKTSYRLIMALVKSGRATIKSDTAYEWDGETFHSMVLRFV